ncbi:hypothetical protein RHSIM_Rhsim09G0207300 [Rhododendron simsii]|uniref:HAT C-terminal dimerisation domain-containing protein n=1 Tax=Rhododendron simsii TaxID=118357 RepID=A0A834LBR4_RHOSS|nr:hypothetical protein RHSIM_Rhsim09G0207300 [Rhododendron simsii]
MSDKSTPNLISWSAVIGGLSQKGYDKEAIEVIYEMQAEGFEPNAQMLASVLPACARLEKLSLGKEIYGYIMSDGFMSNSILINGLLDVYRRCANMVSALKIFRIFLAKNAVSFNTKIVGKGELDRYLEEDVIPRANQDFDVLAWWKNDMKFPTLRVIARDVLSIPVSTVASKSAFSTSGRVVTPHRSRLRPKTKEALMCARSWLLAHESEGNNSNEFASVLDDMDVDSSQSCVTMVED